MSCNSCAKPFSLLRKEKGCPNCGFSYCSKCLDNKAFVIKLKLETKVCGKCKKSMSNVEENKNKIIPPDTFFKRQLEAGNATDDQIFQRLKNLKSDVEKRTTEQEINDRLKNLKGETSTATDAELEARLAKLRGLPVIVSTKPSLPMKDLRSEQEQIDDLMKQYLEQTHIDTKYKNEFNTVIDNMEARINKLKGNNADIKPTENKPEEIIESDDEDTAVRKIVEKMKTEAALEENEISQPTNDELPFCEICNEDAKMRCLGCRYLFCKQCFNEHKDDDDGCDQYEPYKPPRN